MKQATVAGITVAMGPVLHGCGGDDDLQQSCIGRDAQACILNNDDGACHWDPETEEEACFLEPDFDSALFNATAPLSLQPSDLEENNLTWEGCAEYDAVIAQRCLSKCEVDLSYRLKEKATSDESGRPDIRYQLLCSEFDYFDSEQVAFNLPTIVDEIDPVLAQFAEEPGLEYVTFVDVTTALVPDWTPFGKVNDPRLQMHAKFLDEKASITAGQSDLRFVSDSPSDEENKYIAMEDITLGGMTMAQYTSAAETDGETIEAYFAARFADYDEADFGEEDKRFGIEVYKRFLTLDTVSTNAGDSNRQKVNIVQADLEANNFVDMDAFDACSGDRNCGFNYESGACAELQQYCAQWEEDECNVYEHSDTKISMPSPADGPNSPDVPTPTDLDGTERVREFAGYVTYEDQAAWKAKCQYSTAGCAPPQEFVSCDSAGFPTQIGSDEPNVCIFLDLVPVPWSAPTFDDETGEMLTPGYDVEKLEDFATLYEIVNDSGLPLTKPEDNARGCLNANWNEIEGMTYLGGVYGYAGPVCTLPEGYECMVNDLPETPGCNNTLTTTDQQAGICRYDAGEDGSCTTKELFYEKYITEDSQDVEDSEDVEGGDDDDFDGSKIG